MQWRHFNCSTIRKRDQKLFFGSLVLFGIYNQIKPFLIDIAIYQKFNWIPLDELCLAIDSGLVLICQKKMIGMFFSCQSSYKNYIDYYRIIDVLLYPDLPDGNPV